MPGEKTEQPTDKKLRDARKKGQVAQSQDLHKLFITMAGFEVIIGLKDSFLGKIESMMLVTLDSINDPFVFTAQALARKLISTGLVISITVIAAVIVARLVSGFVQYGFLMAPESIKPNFGKFNPVSNVKNIFSMKKVFELFSNLLKACVLGLVFYIVVDSSLREILLASTGSLRLSMEAGADVFIFAARLSLVIFGLVAILDYVVQRHFFMKSQKMSKDDIFREYKQSEGDPQMKGQRKQLAMELMESGPAPVKDVDDANAVVVNPTHFAVALRYVPDETPIPRLLCKGVDDRAQEIIQRARDNNIPIVRYVWLARSLYSTGKESKYIPRKVLKPMAAVYRAINEMKASEEELGPYETIELDNGQ